MSVLALQHLFCFGASLIFSLILTPFIIAAALKRKVVDVPDGSLKQHDQPVPYLGGVVVYISFMIPLALAYPCENKVLWMLLGSTLLLFVGLIDDLLVLSAGQKFIGQIIAVICFLRGGFALKSVFFSSTANLFFSAFWMLSVINAFNLIDIMDGLSTITALVASFVFLLIAFFLKEYTVSLLMISFFAALLGFLMYNKPPAKIYLGDAGALFIGGVLSAIPMLLPWSSCSFDAYYTPAVVLAIPLIEVASLIIIRSYLGIPFYHGSPHHFALYLRRRGWSVWSILTFVIIKGLMLGIIAGLFLFGYLNLVGLALSLAGFLLAWCCIVFYGNFFWRMP